MWRYLPRFFLFLTSIASLRSAPVELAILQINDIYEIAPVAGGSEGGIARVATLRKELEATHPNVLVVLAGDFFSPSALGTAKVDGKRLDGRQMVAALNALPLDLATYGNHEFDLDAEPFADRLSEVRFDWVSGNVTAPDGSMLPHTEKTRVYSFSNTEGETVRFGFFGVTLDGFQKPYAPISDPETALETSLDSLRTEADVLIGLTHQDLADDLAIATDHRGIALVMGGHEHENMYFHRGPDRTVVAKADANARTAWVHRLTHDPQTGETEVASELVALDAGVPLDPEAQTVVEAWTERGFAGFRAEGFEPRRLIAALTEPLDGREAAVRNHPTKLSSLIAEGYRRAFPEAVAAFYNTGSIRIDDVLPPGPLTEYDVIRVHPFGGHLVLVRLKGSVLKRIFEIGQSNAGSGGYLALAGVTPPSQAGDSWQVGSQSLDLEATYDVALNNFLLTGKEAGLGFLQPEAGQLKVLTTGPDVRAAVINELARRYPASEKAALPSTKQTKSLTSR